MNEPRAIEPREVVEARLKAPLVTPMFAFGWYHHVPTLPAVVVCEIFWKTWIIQYNSIRYKNTTSPEFEDVEPSVYDTVNSQNKVHIVAQIAISIPTMNTPQYSVSERDALCKTASGNGMRRRTQKTKSRNNAA